MQKSVYSFLPIIAVIGLAGCSQQAINDSKSVLSNNDWANYSSLKFNISSDDQNANTFQVYKGNDRVIVRVSNADQSIDLIQTQAGALIKNVGETGVYSTQQCQESIGDLHTYLHSYVNTVQFFLKASAPDGVKRSGSQIIDIHEENSNAKVWAGEVVELDLEGESYSLGDYIELQAPWGAKGIIQYNQPTSFDFVYYSSFDGNKVPVKVMGEWGQVDKSMQVFDHELSKNWLACVEESTKNELVKESPQTVAEMLRIIERSH